MKRLLTLLITLITFASCKESVNPTEPNDYIRVQPITELHFLYAESSVVLTIESSGEWSVDGTTEWCSATPEFGIDGDEITISVTNNALEEERSAILTLHCGTASATISVVQERYSNTDYIDMGFDAEGTTTLYDAASGTITVTYSGGNVPNVAVGKAIVLPADYKFDIRVVESVSKSDNTLTLGTSQGNMCNLFRNTSFTLATNGDTRSVDKKGQPIITPVAMGYYDADGKYVEVYNQFKPTTHTTHTINTELWSFNMNWDGATLYEGKGGRLWWDKCAFDAGLDGVFNFDFGEQPGGILGKVGELEEFSYTLQGSIGADLLMHYRYEKSATFSDDSILEYNVIPTKVYTFIVNGVTVHLLIYTHLGQYVEFGAKGSVDISGGVDLGLNVEAGLIWSKDDGVKIIKSATPITNIYHPTIQVEASAYAKFSYYPQVEIGLYGFIGPWFEPRPYIKEQVSAGFRASTDGENYVAFKDEYFSGLDMRMGLKLDFGFFDKEVWKSDVFNVVDDTLLTTSPFRLTLTDPSSSNIEIEEDESIDVEVKVESYSPVTGKYWPCEGAAVVFESESGELSNSFALSDASGIARATWSPTKSTRATTKSHKLKARIYDIDGNVIDEVQLIARVGEENNDREILIKFYHDTGGDNWENNHNWCTDAPLEDWYGVSCNEDGRVTHLYLDNNNLTGCGTLSGCTALEDLNCTYNNLTSLDVSGCTALEYLGCSSNNLTSLDVSGCPALEYLGCSSNNLTSLDVSGCPALEELHCRHNNLTSLDVSGFTALEHLCCDNNQLTSLDVSGCTALKYLWCNYNNLTSLDVSGCTALEYLWCDKNQLTSLDVSGFTALKYLYCYNNNLTSLDVSGCPALEILNCKNNNLTSLDVPGCPALDSLYCPDNNLTSLDVSGCPALEGLGCSSNNLTSLDVSGCPALESLGCSSNNLTSLDVSGCPALEYLECTYNNLTSLDVSGFTALELLWCDKNQLTSLDVSGCTALEYLECTYNNLTSLDVSGCTALRLLDCSDNNLTSLDVSGCTALGWLSCYNNKISQVITEFYDNLYFKYDQRYTYNWDDDGEDFTWYDNGYGWWYPGEPGKGYHGW